MFLPAQNNTVEFKKKNHIYKWNEPAGFFHTFKQFIGCTGVTSEGGASPNTAGHQLEWSGGDLLSRSGHADDDALPPSFVAGLQSSSLRTDTSAVIY